MFCLPKTAWPPTSRALLGDTALCVQEDSLFLLTTLHAPESISSGKGVRGWKERPVFWGVGRRRAVLEKPGGDGTEPVPLRHDRTQTASGSLGEQPLDSRSRIVAMSFCEPRSW